MGVGFVLGQGGHEEGCPADSCQWRHGPPSSYDDTGNADLPPPQCINGGAPTLVYLIREGCRKDTLCSEKAVVAGTASCWLHLARRPTSRSFLAPPRQPERPSIFL